MKKIVIVNNNMRIGGVQKSLYNLLWSLEGRYEITLCLFRKDGVYADRLPNSVRVVETPGLFRYLGVAQQDCHGVDKVKRGFLAAFSRFFGRSKCMRILLAHEKTLPGKYDCAIAFLHNGRDESFYGGVQDYVLRRVNADRKIAFLHGDYRSCGANHKQNNRLIAEFDGIAACSDGCRRAFEEVLPELSSKCVTVRNFHRFDEIRLLGDVDPVIYNDDCIHVVTVSRLSPEKGLDRAISAVAAAVSKGYRVRLHIVGGGVRERELRDFAEQTGASAFTEFHGEQENPYRYMKHADLLLLTSYHEAAPMVIEEAAVLGLPVLAAEFTSSKDMITDVECGWVCANAQEAITEALETVISDKTAIVAMKAKLRARAFDNTLAEKQFAEVANLDLY